VKLYGKVGIAAVAALSLALTACGGSKGSGSNSNNSNQTKKQASSTKNDINPMAYDQVPSGGTLRYPIDSYPPNFNINEIDGNEFNRVLTLNVLAQQVLIAAFDPLLRKSAAGRVVALTSSVGARPLSGRALRAAIGREEHRAIADEMSQFL